MKAFAIGLALTCVMSGCRESARPVAKETASGDRQTVAQVNQNLARNNVSAAPEGSATQDWQLLHEFEHPRPLHADFQLNAGGGELVVALTQFHFQGARPEFPTAYITVDRWADDQPEHSEPVRSLGENKAASGYVRMKLMPGPYKIRVQCYLPVRVEIWQHTHPQKDLSSLEYPVVPREIILEAIAIRMDEVGKRLENLATEAERTASAEYRRREAEAREIERAQARLPRPSQQRRMIFGGGALGRYGVSPVEMGQR